MSGQPLDDRLESVAPGDIISLPLSGEPEAAVRQYKVVRKDSNESSAGPTIVVTLEGDDGELFDVELPADAVVNRSFGSQVGISAESHTAPGFVTSAG